MHPSEVEGFWFKSSCPDQKREREGSQMQMQMEGKNLVVKIPKDLISKDYVERFIERINAGKQED